MKKLNWFARPEKFRNRLIMVILGVLIQGFGLSWLIEIHFGTDPCSAFTQGVISHVGLTFGTAQLLINLILFIIIFLSDTSLIGFGTIANMIFIGYISDTCRWIYSRIFPAHFFESMPVRICILLPALIVFIFGAAMYMTAALGTSPYDAISFILAKKVPHVHLNTSVSHGIHLFFFWDGSPVEMSVRSHLRLHFSLVLSLAGSRKSWLYSSPSTSFRK